jgi:putative glutamine amidotransferase
MATPGETQAVSSRPPLVLVPACNRLLGASAFQVVGQKYVDAVRLAGALPLVVPTAEAHEIDALLALADGIFLTGSPSNVHPGRFGEAVHDPSLPLDVARDAWTLPLIPKALERGIPLLAICRGFQEMNVAFGGTLWQKLHEVEGLHDHREDVKAPLEEQYGPAHEVELTRGGVLQKLAGSDRITVNSLHSQGVQTLGSDLDIEARAPDGVVEAFRVRNAQSLALAVQWHPEWQFSQDPFSVALFAAFGEAARERAHKNRLGQRV